MKMLCAVVAAVALGVGLGLGQLGKESKPASAVATEGKGLDQLAFLKGTWSGKVGADWVEETWSAANGDSIIGMFRWQSGGKTTMWEILSIMDEGGKAVLRLRHFDGKFEAWKNEAGAVEPMPAAEMSSNRVLFAAEKGGLRSVEYKLSKAGTLQITVSFRDEGRPPIEMDLKKQ